MKSVSETRAQWAVKRERGLFRYLLIDGVVFTGGPFAVVMQVVGYFLFADEGQTFGQYFTSTRTWTTFFLHGVLFGTIGGMIKWRRNEAAFADGADEQDT
jgi:hypothetical protein